MPELEDQINELRRNHLLDSALKVFSEKGFERTTIKQIAAEAEVADGTIYNYFENKAAIMTAIVGRLTKAERRDIDFAKGAEMGPAEFLENYLPLRFQEIEEELTTHKVVLAETLSNSLLRDEVNKEIYEPMFEIATTYFEQGAASDLEPAMIARLMCGPFLGLMVLRMLGDSHTTENWHAYGEAMAKLLGPLVENTDTDTPDDNDQTPSPT